LRRSKVRKRVQQILRAGAKKAFESAVTTAASVIVTLALAMVGVAAVSGDVQQGLDVPSEIAEGFGTLVEAAQKYLEEE
jgi:hypothetical protein